MASQDQESSAAAEAFSILAVTRDVCEHLRIKWVPTHVSCDDVYYSGDPTYARGWALYRDVPSNRPVMHWDTLYVSPSMKGRLLSEEWRPVIASSMIYYAKLATRKDFGIITRMTLLLLLVGAGLYPLLLAGVPLWDFILLLLGVYLGVTIGGVLLLVFPYLRKLWLKADELAADYVGPLNMIAVLEKVQGFHLAELEGGRLSEKQSLVERIAKLKNTGLRSAVSQNRGLEPGHEASRENMEDSLFAFSALSEA